jgi:hypothetical protein
MRKLKSFLLETLVFKIYLKYKNRQVTDGLTKINILKTFPLFEAHGWGLYPIRAKLTM